MLSQEFIAKGFCYIKPEFYFTHDNLPSIHDLKKIFDVSLQEDGNEFRKRAYLKIQWDKIKNQITIADNQNYFQTASSNKVDGGKVRQFKTIPKNVLDIPIVAQIFVKNLSLIARCPLVLHEDILTVGLHFIRYQVKENSASYSSPDWLHKDDEPLVFIHLINLSKMALGGDSLIADTHSKKVSNVVRLENDMDTLVLNQNVYHAVTPLGSRHGIATRDVILFTVEPPKTQVVGS